MDPGLADRARRARRRGHRPFPAPGLPPQVPRPRRPAAMIELHRLTKRFGSTLAVGDLSFTVERGQVVGFLGPNGAGKTTTLRMLLGLITPTAGTATIAGHPYRNLSDPLHTVGAALEGSSCHPGRTARN